MSYPKSTGKYKSKQRASLKTSTKVKTSKKDEVMARAYPRGEIILYHGSPVKNELSIRRHGIRPVKWNIEEKYEAAVDLVAKAYDLDAKQKRAVRRAARSRSMYRLTEREKDFPEPVIFVSGEKNYTIQNSMASREYIESIIISSEYIKWKTTLDRLHTLHSRIAKKHRQVEAIHKKTWGRDVDTSGPDWKLTYKKNQRDMKRINKSVAKDNKAYAVLFKPLGKVKVAMRRKLMGNDYVLFEIKMPVEEFKRQLGSNSSRGRVTSYEELAADPERLKEIQSFTDSRFGYFRELQLKFVHPKYIRVIERGERDLDKLFGLKKK